MSVHNTDISKHNKVSDMQKFKCLRNWGRAISSSPTQTSASKNAVYNMDAVCQNLNNLGVGGVGLFVFSETCLLKNILCI